MSKTICKEFLLNPNIEILQGFRKNDANIRKEMLKFKGTILDTYYSENNLRDIEKIMIMLDLSFILESLHSKNIVHCTPTSAWCARCQQRKAKSVALVSKHHRLLTPPTRPLHMIFRSTS